MFKNEFAGAHIRDVKKLQVSALGKYRATTFSARAIQIEAGKMHSRYRETGFRYKKYIKYIYGLSCCITNACGYSTQSSIAYLLAYIIISLCMYVSVLLFSVFIFF